jgi:hypothetical protein
MKGVKRTDVANSIKIDPSQVPRGFYPMIKYRIDNSGCHAAYVPGYGDKTLFDTKEEAIEGARILNKHPEHTWRRNPYLIVKLDIAPVPEGEKYPSISKHARHLETTEIEFNDDDTIRSQTDIPSTLQ